MVNTLKRWFIFESRFPTEKERYDKYLWLLKLSIICTVIHGAAILSGAVGAASIIWRIDMFLYLWITVILWQEYWKSKTIHFAFRLALCAASSIILTMMLVPFLGPLPIILGAVVALFANRKQLKKFWRYKLYLKYIVLWLGISVVLHVLNTICSGAYNLPLILYAAKRLILFYFFYCLLRHECNAGRPFKECIRILTLIPLSLGFMLLGWLSILPIGNVSSKSLFGDDNHDFLALEN